MLLLARILIGITAICLLAMMVHVSADVIMKALFNSPVPGTIEVVARYYMVAAIFLPLPLVELRNSAISVDLFFDMFGAAGQRLLTVIAYVGQAVFFSLLAYRTFGDALHAYAIGEAVEGLVRVTVWPASFFLPLGFGLAAIISMLRIVQTVVVRDWARVTEHHTTHDADQVPTEVA